MIIIIIIIIIITIIKQTLTAQINCRRTSQMHCADVATEKILFNVYWILDRPFNCIATSGSRG